MSMASISNRSVLRAAVAIILVAINLTEAAKLGLIGAGLLLNSITKSMVLPLPFPLPLQIIYGPGPSVIHSKPQFIPIPHPIPVPIPVEVEIPDGHKEMVRRMDPMNVPPFDPYCNYVTLSNGDSKIISREPLPTTIKGRTVVRFCQQPVPNINSGKYQVVFKGNRKSSFGSIRVSIKIVHYDSRGVRYDSSDKNWQDLSPSASSTNSQTSDPNFAQNNDWNW